MNTTPKKAKRSASLTIEQQQRMYDVLRKIARQYRTSESILRRPDKGLSGSECLEYAYDNIQSEAAWAIKGVKRPVQLTNEQPSE